MEIFASERKAIASKLLGDRAGSLSKTTHEKISKNRASDTDRINAMVLVKARILATDQGVDKIVGDLVKRDHFTILSSEAGVIFALMVENDRAFVHLVDGF